MAERPVPPAAATLCAYHAELSPSELSVLLGVEPTRIHDAKEHRFESTPNGWFLEAGSTAPQLSPQLWSIVDVVRKHQPQIRKANARGWHFRLMCFAQVPPHQSLAFEAADMALFGRLSIDFEFYVA